MACNSNKTTTASTASKAGKCLSGNGTKSECKSAAASALAQAKTKKK